VDANHGILQFLVFDSLFCGRFKIVFHNKLWFFIFFNKCWIAF